jgi:hypothetical protein
VRHFADGHWPFEKANLALAKKQALAGRIVLVQSRGVKDRPASVDGTTDNSGWKIEIKNPTSGDADENAIEL